MVFWKKNKQKITKKKVKIKKKAEQTSKIFENKDTFDIIHYDLEGKEFSREQRTKKIVGYLIANGKRKKKIFNVGIWGSNNELTRKLMDLGTKEIKKSGDKKGKIEF